MLFFCTDAVEDESDGYTKRTRADFLLPNNSKMEVTLKLLKNEKEGEYLKVCSGLKGPLECVL